MYNNFYTLCATTTIYNHCIKQRHTTRSRNDDIQNAHWNAHRNAEWMSQVSFQTVYLKRNLNSDHTGFFLPLRFAFGAKSLVFSEPGFTIPTENTWNKHVWTWNEYIWNIHEMNIYEMTMYCHRRVPSYQYMCVCVLERVGAEARAVHAAGCHVALL